MLFDHTRLAVVAPNDHWRGADLGRADVVTLALGVIDTLCLVGSHVAITTPLWQRLERESPALAAAMVERLGPPRPGERPEYLIFNP